MKERLDVLLVEKGFFTSREKAKRAIMAGIVIVNETKIEKAGTQIKLDPEPIIRLKGQTLKYVSRGGLKLEKALEVFNLDFKGKKILDVGSSTGGFTDCSLMNGADFVYAVDVGSNQLDWKLRNDPRVKSMEQMHIKNLQLLDVDNEKVDFIVMDVSFISITKVIEHLGKFMRSDTKLMALIKPQFEVGKDNIEKGGIVKSFKMHKFAMEKVIEGSEKFGIYLDDMDVSPITGGKGNVEYISLFSLGEKKKVVNLDVVIEKGKVLKSGGK